MSLLDVIVIEIGAAIAKLILKLWVKNASLADNISSSLIDLFKSQTSDILAQRRGQRQFYITRRLREALDPMVEAGRFEIGYRKTVARNNVFLAQRSFEQFLYANGILRIHDEYVSA